MYVCMYVCMYFFKEKKRNLFMTDPWQRFAIVNLSSLIIKRIFNCIVSAKDNIWHTVSTESNQSAMVFVCLFICIFISYLLSNDN